MPTRNAYSPEVVKAAVALAAERQRHLRARVEVVERSDLTDPELRAERGRLDPRWYVREVLGVDLYERQLEIFDSVRDNEQTTVNGANGVGKDYAIGRLIAWWQETHYPAKTILTGPTSRQVNEIVWRETRSAYNSARYPLRGAMLPRASKWEGPGDEHFALGFSTDKPANITGFHSPNLLVVVSEAHNVGDEVFVSLQRLHPTRLLLSGNPFSESGEFFDSHHRKRHLYNPITITAWDSPNVLAGADVVPGLVNQRDIEKGVEDYGAESPIFRATFKAEFAGRADGLIRLAWVVAARKPAPFGAKLVNAKLEDGFKAGLDVAGPGEDETSLWIRRGRAIVDHRSWRIDDPRGEVVAALMPYKAKLESLNVDSAGLGWGMYLHLRDIFGRDVVHGVNVGEASSKPERFENLKAELYWGLRERFADGDVVGLDDPIAESQLVSLRYEHSPRGRIRIESKDDAKKRGQSSPDRAEGIMLCYAERRRRGLRAL